MRIREREMHGFYYLIYGITQVPFDIYAIHV